jgi:hypothetical protein
MARSRIQPLDYRQDEVGRVMERWRASESCSLVGVGSVGKSNLLLHLADTRVQQKYMRETRIELFKAIVIDPSMLGPLPAEGRDFEQIRCWLGYELMMHRLFLAFHQSNLLSSAEMARFVEVYETLQDGSNPLYAFMGLRYFELALDIIMNKGIQIVFMFDEFEEMLRSLPIKFFLTLRGLRDSNKSQLSYLTFTRAPIPVVLEKEKIDLLRMEEFIELFTDNVLYIGPYNNRDARRMIDDLCQRNNKSYSDYIKEFLIWSTGGFAGLLRASFRSLENFDDITLSSVMTGSLTIAKELAKKTAVRAECRTIWTSLTDIEQQILRAAAGTQPFERTTRSDEAVEYLVRKKLIVPDASNGNRLSINPPVFHYFVVDNPDLA